MPATPPSYKGSIESSESSPSAPQSPVDRINETERIAGKQKTMLTMMGGVHDSWRHVEDHRIEQPPRTSTRVPPVESSVARLPEILPRPRISDHVSEFDSEQMKNDTSETATNRSFSKPEAASTVHQSPSLSQPPPSSTTTSGQIEQPLLTAQFLRASVKAAVASTPSKVAPTSSSSFTANETTGKTGTMSIDKLVPDEKIAPKSSSKKARSKRSPQRQLGQSTGRWTREEHQAFLEGLKECGREWKKVAERIPTRTSAQIRSHAQKYFAKIQREQDTMVFPEHHAGAAVPMEGGAAHQQIAPSVQRNIEQLLSNPETAQRRVETTLDALRERYRQLQRRLERRQQQRRSQQSRARLVETENAVDSRKRSFREMDEHHQQGRATHHQSDENSSVCSNLSASVASLGNEELIALHVLGGALPRGDSSIDETATANNDEETDDGTKPSSPKKKA